MLHHAFFFNKKAYKNVTYLFNFRPMINFKQEDWQ